MTLKPHCDICDRIMRDPAGTADPYQRAVKCGVRFQIMRGEAWDELEICIGCWLNWQQMSQGEASRDSGLATDATGVGDVIEVTGPPGGPDCPCAPCRDKNG